MSLPYTAQLVDSKLMTNAIVMAPPYTPQLVDSKMMTNAIGMYPPYSPHLGDTDMMDPSGRRRLHASWQCPPPNH